MGFRFRASMKKLFGRIGSSKSKAVSSAAKVVQLLNNLSILLPQGMYLLLITITG